MLLLLGGGLLALTAALGGGSDDADLPGTEDPDGEDPGGEDPDGEDPDGEDPDGETPDNGDRLIRGTADADRIVATNWATRGMGADDTLTYNLGDGGDYYSFGGPNNPTLPDIARLEVNGQDGDDRIAVYAGGIEQYVTGGRGDDIIVGNGLGGSDDTFMGGQGNDTLIGQTDSLNGGGGDDLLIAEPVWQHAGSPETDATVTTLTGGSGTDTFMSYGDTNWVEADGSVVMPDVLITDFQPGSETLFLPPVLVNGDSDPADPYAPEHILSDIAIDENDDGTIVTATYEPLLPDGQQVTHRITLDGVSGMSRDDILVGLRADGGTPEAAFEPRPDQNDANGHFIYIAPSDAGEMWFLANVESTYADLGAGDDTINVGNFSQNDTWPYPRGDVILGGAGNDVIDIETDERDPAGAHVANTMIWGGDGDDTLIASIGSGVADGGAGNDFVQTAYSYPVGYWPKYPAVLAAGGTGEDEVVIFPGHDADLGADQDADYLIITADYGFADMGTPTNIHNLGDEDQIEVIVDASEISMVTASIDNGMLMIRWQGQLIATGAYSGDPDAVLIDPDNPDALIRVTPD